MSFDLGMKYQKSTFPKSTVALNWKTQQQVHIIIIFIEGNATTWGQVDVIFKYVQLSAFSMHEF